MASGAGGGRSASHTAVLALLLGLFAAVIGVSGSDLVEVARLFKTRQDLEAVRTMVLVYHARHGALPGADPRGFAAVPPGVRGLAGNGRWDGPPVDLASPQPTEAVAAWLDLARAGLWQAEPQAAYVPFLPLPRNRFGGAMLFADRVLGLGPSLCLTGVPAAAAVRLDHRLDDGDTVTGRLRAAVVEGDSTGGLRALGPGLTPSPPPEQSQRAMAVCLEVDPR
ncbi:hypothetical protein [Caenispirillum bisanense]|uniref:hypothetical protein n=1 Tax=Caenispirillum bisanense TaxID=414052 RepID=UPI0031E3B0D5